MVTLNREDSKLMEEIVVDLLKQIKEENSLDQRSILLEQLNSFAYTITIIDGNS